MTLCLSFTTFCRPNFFFAFDFLQHHVHIRHRRDYDKQKAVAISLIIACSLHAYTFLFFTHISFVMNHTINATPPERLQQYVICETIWFEHEVTQKSEMLESFPI